MYVDRRATFNTSTFTMMVNDSAPHFFYMVEFNYQNDCASLVSYNSTYDLPADVDIVFVLNPVLPPFDLSKVQDDTHTLEGYKRNMVAQGNIFLTFPDYPQRGELVLKARIPNIEITLENNTEDNLGNSTAVGSCPLSGTCPSSFLSDSGTDYR